MTVTFQLEGQEFTALNGGPEFKFTEAISFFVNCETQQEVDELWEKLSAGGEKGPCGWLKDRYGLSWQIVPTALGQMLGDKDTPKIPKGDGGHAENVQTRHCSLEASVRGEMIQQRCDRSDGV